MLLAFLLLLNQSAHPTLYWSQSGMGASEQLALVRVVSSPDIISVCSVGLASHCMRLKLLGRLMPQIKVLGLAAF